MYGFKFWFALGFCIVNFLSGLFVGAGFAAWRCFCFLHLKVWVLVEALRLGVRSRVWLCNFLDALLMIGIERLVRVGGPPSGGLMGGLHGYLVCTLMKCKAKYENKDICLIMIDASFGSPS